MVADEFPLDEGNVGGGFSFRNNIQCSNDVKNHVHHMRDSLVVEEEN